MTPDDRKVILASARKIIADAAMIVRDDLRRDIQVEAVTIVALLGEVAAEADPHDFHIS